MKNKFKEIRESLEAYGIDAIMLTGAPCRRYATGFPSSAGMVVVTKTKSYFATDSRYIEAARAGIEDAEINLIGAGRKYTLWLNEIIKEHNIKKLGFEDGATSHREYLEYSEKIEAQLVPAQKLMAELRAVKSQDEIAAMSSAQSIADKVFDELLTIINSDMTENDLASEIIYRLRRNGAENISFDPIVASGTNTSRPHAVPGKTHLVGFITMDFGCMYDGYCSDMTRTVALGEVTDEMRTVYDTVLKAQLAGIAAAKAGVSGKAVDSAARNVIEAAGYGEYFQHGFGHSLGIEIHENPNASQTETALLPEGAVISAEPGIYIPGKFGVRIEDAIVITRTGNINLTKSPKELIII